METFEQRAAKVRERVDKAMAAESRRQDPDEREKVLRRAQEIVNDGRTVRVNISSSEVLAVARFLMGEPG